MAKSGRLRGAERIIDQFLAAHLHKGRLTMIYPSGQKRKYGDDTSDPVKVMIRSLPLPKLRNPAMFLGESYMNGNILIDERQLDAFFRLMGDNPSDSALTSLIEKLPKRQANRRHKQRQQIAHHYDIGNDYYRLWLDKETMLYTCAYFKTPKDSLAQAQKQKIDHVLNKLQIKPGQSVLDIGCGWGYLLLRAAEEYGATGLGVTLSEEQHAYATKQAKQRGLDKQVSFELTNYQDLLKRDVSFDRVISVGIMEHVGRGNHQSYFDVVKHTLKDGGVSVLHTITEMKDKPASPWIDKYIFPGGYLPTVDGIEKLLAENRFWSIDRENLWEHYARTLDIWRANHQAHRKDIIDMFDETFYRMQDFWLAGSAATFRYGDTGLNQFIFSKGKPAFDSWPLTRDYLT